MRWFGRTSVLAFRPYPHGIRKTCIVVFSGQMALGGPSAGRQDDLTVRRYRRLPTFCRFNLIMSAEVELPAPITAVSTRRSAGSNSA